MLVYNWDVFVNVNSLSYLMCRLFVGKNKLVGKKKLL